MRSIDARVTQLERKLNTEVFRAVVTCIFREDESKQGKQAEALKQFNEEHGTAFTEGEVDWITFEIVNPRGVVGRKDEP